jgi:hypothetical protein
LVWFILLNCSHEIQFFLLCQQSDGKEMTKLSQFLKGLGADEVVDEATLQNYKFKNTVISKYGAPTLAVNAAGGQSATDIARYLK